MSLVSFAVRHIVSRLIVGQTWAGSHIHNSPVDPLPDWEGAEGDDTPRISIYTTERDLDVVGKQTQGRSTSLSIAFNIIVPPKVVVLDGETPQIEFDTRTAGGAASTEFVARQIERALHFGNPEWLAIWHLFVTKIDAVKNRPLVYQIGSETEVPVLSVAYDLNCIPEPFFGEQGMTPGWQALYDAMAADSATESLAEVIRSLIVAPEGLSNWEQARHQMGWTVEDARVAGIAPADPTTTDDAAILTEITTSDIEDE
ncbi:hypothetical protein [Maritalea porphyrae]|uniref:hypothetical protein n=1 Tax=Maritalea porphyrae TaxID=880732 RepID=UPI0022AF8A71|nr:hypothetical protein [Maritalea porphyrae]MCZ4270721.1 hypothetical protein [Maritalea porphyrae]